MVHVHEREIGVSLVSCGVLVLVLGFVHFKKPDCGR
jgi:hypothetical protein